MLHVGTLRGPFATIVNSMHLGFRVSSATPWHPSGAPWGAQGCTYSLLGGLLGLPGDSLGCLREPSGALLGALGASPGSPGAPCGVPWDSPGTPWVLPVDSPGLPGTPWVLPVDPPGTPRESLGLPVDSPGSPGTPRGPVGLSRDSLGTPQRIPGRRTLKRMQRCCPMVLHRAVLQRARFERWVVSRVLPLIRFILKRASPPPITHRTYRRSGPVGDPEGGYIGRPRSMDMKCHHKIGREIWEWDMAEPFVV